jgi:exosortase/archaeosortase family protein
VEPQLKKADHKPTLAATLDADNATSSTPSVLDLLKFVCLVLAVGWLWWCLVSHLSLAWNLNPQYGYGWAVPMLCAYLAWQAKEKPSESAAPQNSQPSSHGTVRHAAACLPLLRALGVVVLAVLIFPIRLVQTANPEWRMVSWALALTVIVLTLFLLPALLLGWQVVAAKWKRWHPVPPLSASCLVFPVCFFLVAVPWPTFIEAPLITGLTETNAVVAVEILNAIGIPAIKHGNLIEIGKGVVGLQEACSGIRSLQATLMISLFLGELYRFSILRRFALCLAGFALAFLFNVGRTTLLTWVAAQRGTEAIASWHDPAGLVILLGCLVSLWAVSQRLARTRSAGDATAGNCPSIVANPTVDCRLPETAHFSIWLPATLSFCIATSELGVAAWFRHHEARLGPPLSWAVEIPEQHHATISTQIPEASQTLLHADHYLRASWAASRAHWQLIFLAWNPGPASGYLSKIHNPQTCMPSSGYSLVSMSEPRTIGTGNLDLPYRRYVFQKNGAATHVYYFVWDDRAKQRTMLGEGNSAWQNRLRAVFLGRGNSGQRTLEIAIQGDEDESALDETVRHELARMIVVESPSPEAVATKH